MIFNFVDKIPADPKLQPMLISGQDSLKLDEHEYLIIIKPDNEKLCFKINYECHFSPFKEATIIENLLAVGHEDFFYMFDLKIKMNILRLKMDGYFGHLYTHNELFYITDSCGAYCIDKNSSILWHSKDLGIDGVILHEFTSDNIKGSGEWDPPGGWLNFVIDKQTGSMKK